MGDGGIRKMVVVGGGAGGGHAIQVEGIGKVEVLCNNGVEQQLVVVVGQQPTLRQRLRAPRRHVGDVEDLGTLLPQDLGIQRCELQERCVLDLVAWGIACKALQKKGTLCLVRSLHLGCVVHDADECVDILLLLGDVVPALVVQIRTRILGKGAAARHVDVVRHVGHDAVLPVEERGEGRGVGVAHAKINQDVTKQLSKHAPERFLLLQGDVGVLGVPHRTSVAVARDPDHKELRWVVIEPRTNGRKVLLCNLIRLHEVEAVPVMLVARGVVGRCSIHDSKVDEAHPCIQLSLGIQTLCARLVSNEATGDDIVELVKHPSDCGWQIV